MTVRYNTLPEFSFKVLFADSATISISSNQEHIRVTYYKIELKNISFRINQIIRCNLQSNSAVSTRLLNAHCTHFFLLS